MMKYVLVFALTLAGCATPNVGSNATECEPGDISTAEPIVEVISTTGKLCSGVLVSEDTIFTAKHCTDTDYYMVRFSREPGVIYTAEYYAEDRLHDLAAVRLHQAAPVRPTAIARGTYPGVTYEFHGYGCGKRPVPRVRPFVLGSDNAWFASFKGCVCKGDSGGPVLDVDGKVVSIIHSRPLDMAYARDFGHGVPLAAVRAFYATLE